MKLLLFTFIVLLLSISSHQSHEGQQTLVEFASKTGKTCLLTRECSPTEYCTGNPLRKIHGTCEKRYANFCQGSHQCDHGKKQICQSVNFNHGKCITINMPDVAPAADLQSPNSELNVFIPHLTKEEYDAIPFPQKSEDTMHQEGHGSTCGNEFHSFGYGSHSNVSRDILETCPDTSTGCDNPTVRNTYTATADVVLKLQWLVFKCSDNWWQNAAAKIAEATFDLNNRFKTIGIQFNSYMSTYPCTGTSGNQDYQTFTDGEATGAVSLERGANWMSEGSLMVVAGTPTNSLLNGFFYFPCSVSPCGTGFMNTRVVAKGFTTLSHELGHGFGLHHTFHGVSEVTTCGGCRETVASENTGDYCADTPPVVKNWDCVSPLAGTDTCDNTRTSWSPNPYTNIMSYGNCRDVFTDCQKKRVRCNYKKYLTWLKPDTTPSQSPRFSPKVSPKTSPNSPKVSPNPPKTSPKKSPNSPKVSPKASAKTSSGSLTCFGVASTSSSVCSGRGKCNAKDVCTCDQYWGGSKCDTFNFFGAGNSLQSNVFGTLFFMICVFATFVL